MSAAYPGYKRECNGCGLYCLAVPCAVSSQFGLWRNGACCALQELSEKRICKVITNPRSVSIRLSKASLESRKEAIGSFGVCDHRAAWSIDDAKMLLSERNAADEIFSSDKDTYPRACIAHLTDGKYFCLQHEKGGELEMEKLVA